MMNCEKYIRLVPQPVVGDCLIEDEIDGFNPTVRLFSPLEICPYCISLTL